MADKKKVAEPKTEVRTIKDIKAELADVYTFLENLQSKHEQALQIKAKLLKELEEVNKDDQG